MCVQKHPLAPKILCDFIGNLWRQRGQAMRSSPAPVHVGVRACRVAGAQRLQLSFARAGTNLASLQCSKLVPMQKRHQHLPSATSCGARLKTSFPLDDFDL